MKKHTVVFLPSGKSGEINDGASLLDAAGLLGVTLDSICGGNGICGKCKVLVKEGMSGLGGLTDAESEFIKPSDGPTRLACQCRIHGNAILYAPTVERFARKGALGIPVSLDPAVKKYFVRVDPPSMQDMGKGDRERLMEALHAQHGLSGLSLDYFALMGLQDALRKGRWDATVSVWRGKEIVRLEPGLSEAAFGLAVDIGTTTVAGYLCDLTSGKIINTVSAMNPQSVHGEDVMSRISYSMANPDGLKEMQGEIINCVNGIIGETGLSAADIVDMTVVCNTVMHHIFLGVNPAGIGVAPFVPAVTRPLDVKARELGININQSSYVHFLPAVAGFVGPDSAAVLIAEEPYRQDEKVLIIDIGTNGEILLGDNNGVICAACATGPAFEGAQIKSGMRAAEGAIEKVRIDAGTKEPSLGIIGNVKAKGICGSGIIDAVAELFRAGIIDKSGRLEPPRTKNISDTERLRRDAGGRPEYVLAWPEETQTGAAITITQADVRAVQLAKGALYAGAKLLMRRMGIEKVDKVILAGAFGSYINKESALTIGMFPECALENIRAAGNAAGEGAVLALLNMGKREEAQEEVMKLNHLEIATDPDFQEEFLAAMDIPHR